MKVLLLLLICIMFGASTISGSSAASVSASNSSGEIAAQRVYSPNHGSSVVIEDNMATGAPGILRSSVPLAGNGTYLSVVLVGKLQTLHTDIKNGTANSRFILFLANATVVDLIFSSPPARSYVNQNVRVTGDLMISGENRTMHVTGIGFVTGLRAQITAPAVSGNQPTLVILVKYFDFSAEPHTNSYFVSDMFSSSTPSLNLYYQENSFNMITSITGTVVGWNRLPNTKAYYTTNCGGADYEPCTTHLRNDAVNTVSGVNWASYTRLIILVNSDLGCGCAFAYVGQVVPQQTPGGQFYYSESFVPDDGWGATAGHGFGIIAHEYGHGLGLYHSGYNYNSLWDVMSGGTYATTGPVHTIGYQKIIFGWVSGTEILTVASGSYALDVVVNQVETNPPPGGVQVVKVMTSVATKYYTIEVREKIGYDQGLPPTVGVIIHYVDETLYDWNAQVVLPSGSVCGAGCSDTSGAAWQVGQTFISSANSIKIVIKSATSNSFTVDLNPPPSVPVTFQLSGVSADATGTILTVDSSSYQISQFPLTISLILTTHTLAATTTVPGGTTKQYIWLSWSDSQPATHTITVSGPTTYTITYKTQYTLTIAVSPSSGGTTNPSPSGSPYWEDAGTNVAVTENLNPGYSFYFWNLDGTNVGSAASYSVSMNSPHTLTALFRGTSSISFTRSSSSLTLGDSVAMSGQITPNPGLAQVTLSFSGDSGSTWVSFITVTSDGAGSYSTSWTPPHPGGYLLKASWGGNDQFAGSTSSSVSLTVTGTVTPSPTLLLSNPSTASQGQSVTLSVTIFNPTSSPLNANVTIQITGPGNYVLFDVIPVQLGASTQLTTYYDWTVPNQSGAYMVTVGLLSSQPTGTDMGTIRYATGTIQVT